MLDIQLALAIVALCAGFGGALLAYAITGRVAKLTNELQRVSTDCIVHADAIARLDRATDNLLKLSAQNSSDLRYRTPSPDLAAVYARLTRLEEVATALEHNSAAADAQALRQRLAEFEEAMRSALESISKSTHDRDDSIGKALDELGAKVGQVATANSVYVAALNKIAAGRKPKPTEATLAPEPASV